MIKFEPLSKESLLSKVSQEEIMEKYLGVPVTGTPFISPFRKDTKPGCNYWRSKSGKLYFKDWARDITWDCFAVVMYKYNLNFFGALKKINKDFKLDLGVRVNREPAPIKLKAKERKTLQSFPQSWSDSSLAYWAKYGIDELMLNRYFVYDTSSVYVDNNLSQRATRTNPIFTYLYPPTTNIKIYRPFDKTKKWQTTATKDNVDGLYQLPKNGKMLIITSSRKDLMVLKTMGFYAVSSALNESAMISEVQIKKLKKRFKYILVFMDTDKAGFKASHKYWDKYKFESIYVPPKYGTKDISDFRSKFGHRKTHKLIKKLVKDKFNSRQLPF